MRYKLISTRHKALRASTLAELLVVMIVAGIVLLIVTDGLDSVRRLTASMTGRITASSRFYDDYYRLESLIAASDSMVAGDGAYSVAIYDDGTPYARLHYADSSVIVRIGAVYDTLFGGVADLRCITGPVFARFDTLSLVFASGLRIGFTPAVSAALAASIKTDSMEKEFWYDTD